MRMNEIVQELPEQKLHIVDLRRRGQLGQGTVALEVVWADVADRPFTHDLRERLALSTGVVAYQVVFALVKPYANRLGLQCSSFCNNM